MKSVIGCLIHFLWGRLSLRCRYLIKRYLCLGENINKEKWPFIIKKYNLFSSMIRVITTNQEKHINN